jgi:chaperonin GroES
MSLNLKPLADRLIVEPLEQEEKTPSGIILPETAKEKPQEGKVLAIGPGRWDEEGKKRVPFEIKVGDRVIFAKYSGTEFKYRENGTEKKYLILSEKDVLAVVES